MSMLRHPCCMESPLPRSQRILQDPRLNKGTAFTEAERDALGLRGLLPSRVFTMREQEIRVLGNLHRKTSDLEKYIFMVALLDRNEILFYRTVMDNIEEMLPIIYTPTVGEACQQFGQIFRRPRGLYISANDRGRVATILENWPERGVQIIVVTDGERILGLGDLGAHGMGIPVGKLSLYTACAGIHPARCLPIMLDVGTNNETLLRDPLYIGLLQGRVRGDDYDALLDELITAAGRVFPGVLIQFEDFATDNAFRLLAKYRDRACVFNDDMQGTAAVTLAGLLSATRVTGRKLQDERILFLGAGEAGRGIADLVTSTLMPRGLSESEARQHSWFFDSRGLVVRSRTDLKPHKKPYAHDHPPVATFLDAVSAVQPTILVGVSGQPHTFTEPVVRRLAALNRHPIVFALSNPTSRSECTAEEVYRWTDGRAVFASGSPFAAVVHDGTTFVPGQANNAYIFPGVGLGVVASGAQRVTDDMFTVAATILADATSPESLAKGTLFPPLGRIREVSLAIAVAVAERAYADDLATRPRPKNLPAQVRGLMYEPTYPAYT